MGEQEASRVAGVALGKLKDALARHGNKIDAKHEEALADLTLGLARQLTRATVGRVGYPLTCGAGKTQALVAVLAAAHELGLPHSVVVAAQKVTDLAKIRRDLRLAGVPAAALGLVHSKRAGEVHNELADAMPPVLPEDCTPTGEEDRQFLLATHEMLRRGGREGIASAHRGRRRDLMVWDETLLLSEAGAIALRDLETTAFHFGDRQPAAAAFLKNAARKAGEELIRQQRGCTPVPFFFDCDPEQQADLASLARASGRQGAHARAAAETLRAVLQLVGQPVALAIPRGNGEAIIHHQMVIDPDSDNIAVLDASHVVRLLGRIGVQEAGSAAMRSCKRYDDCTAVVYPLAASKSAQSDRAKAKKVAAVAARIIATLPGEERAVLFTFKATRGILESELAAAGIDLRATVDGKPRIAIATWGTEAGTNQHAGCAHVILAGVLRQDRARLVAQWAGEHGDLTHHPDATKLREVEVSEMASCALQALSRGRSRVSVVGPGGESQARSQSVHIIDSDAERVARMLHDSGCLPGMQWAMGDADKGDSLTAKAAAAVAAVLAGLPAGVGSISSRELKRRAIEAGAPESLNETSWTRSIRLACQGSAFTGGHAWMADGRSLRRARASGVEALDLTGVRPLSPTSLRRTFFRGHLG